jgi:nitrogen fixation/metabolism regulation signal transduction histidine kinase
LKAGRESGDLSVDLIEWSVSGLQGNLEQLNDLVARRLGFDRGIEDLLTKHRKSHGNAQRLLSTATAELEYEIEISRVMAGDSGTASDGQTGQDAQLTGLITMRRSLENADMHLAAIHNALLEAELAKQPERFAALAIQAQVALGVFESIAASLDPELAEALTADIEQIRQTIEGPTNLFSGLEGQFSMTQQAREVLVDNSVLSSELTATVDQLVAISKTNITDSFVEATSVQRMSTQALMVVVALSLIGSVLIVWLYVGRNLVARLTELSVCMESVAGGDLKVELPDSKSDDEIGRMTKALTIFRDTAVEIEESNLREIGQARQRLLDAIEAISEGFCFFDANDRLVVANNRYRTLMYPGDDTSRMPRTVSRNGSRSAWRCTANRGTRIFSSAATIDGSWSASAGPGIAAP